MFEEYEALRLCDYDMYNHHQASVIMGVSRPTFTRIYSSVRQKIAKAFVEGRQISIEGGKVYFDSNWYSCSQCGCYFNNPEMDKPVEMCPLCGENQFIRHDFENELDENMLIYSEDTCVCSSCGYEQRHQLGNPCKHQICPKCNGYMRRKGVKSFKQ